MFFYAFVVIKTMQNVGIEWIVNKQLMEVGHDWNMGNFIMIENAMHFNHGDDRLSYEPCTCAKALKKNASLMNI